MHINFYHNTFTRMHRISVTHFTIWHHDHLPSVSRVLGNIFALLEVSLFFPQAGIRPSFCSQTPIQSGLKPQANRFFSTPSFYLFFGLLFFELSKQNFLPLMELLYLLSLKKLYFLHICHITNCLITHAIS